MARHGMRLVFAVLILQSLSVAAQTSADGPSTSAVPVVEQHPLLALERNRASVVQRIVGEWAEVLPTLPAERRLTKEKLAEALWQLRADRLLAASLAGSFAAIEALLADAQTEQAEMLRPQRVATKALGDANADLVYTPINPCRIADTRLAGGALSANIQRTFDGFSANFSPQGGTATNCGMPNGVAAIAMNVYAVNPTNLGFIKVWGANATEPAVSTVNYQTGIVAIATGAIVPVDAANSNRFIAKSPAQVDFIADVVGYFKAAAVSGFFRQGGNGFGTKGFLGTTDNFDLEFLVNGTRVMTYQRSGPNGTSPQIVGGHPNNFANTFQPGQTIGGGGESGSDCFEPADGTFTRGCRNETAADFATIGGGMANRAFNSFATVGGGESNRADGHATVSGGFGNTAGGSFSTVAGGRNNRASGTGSFAAGSFANANVNGCFAFGDSSTSNVVSCGVTPNQFVARALGGVYFLTAGNTDATYTGAALAPGATAWTTYSDSAGKDNIRHVDAVAILRKVAALPIATWNWKSQDASIRHMGPMAQDFHAAFGLGETPRGISTVDADGVALAAIQGLHVELRDRDTRIVRQNAKIAALEVALKDLKRAVEALADKR